MQGLQGLQAISTYFLHPPLALEISRKVVQPLQLLQGIQGVPA
jgi:hypothetical protein